MGDEETALTEAKIELASRVEGIKILFNKVPFTKELMNRWKSKDLEGSIEVNVDMFSKKVTVAFSHVTDISKLNRFIRSSPFYIFAGEVPVGHDPAWECVAIIEDANNRVILRDHNLLPERDDRTSFTITNRTLIHCECIISAIHSSMNYLGPSISK